VTDAEELGLAGAQAWPVTTLVRADAVILNCDGVDDAGDNVVMYAGRPPHALLAGVTGAAATTGVPCRAKRLALGVLTDSVAFGYAGFPSVTFSRGTLASLARVHSKRDDLRRLRGTGIAPVATLIAATANQLGSWGKR
jgi:Zn-dependent M28 family amino/carboxypeptidase